MKRISPDPKQAVSLRAKEAIQIVSDDLWIDHIEDDLDRTLANDLDLLAFNSKSDRKAREVLKRTRVSVRESDDVLLPESGHFYKGLHDKIMAAVEEEGEINSSMFMYSKKLSRRSTAAAIGTIGLMTILVAASMLSMKSVMPDRAASAAVAQHRVRVGFDQSLAMASENDRRKFSESLIDLDENSELYNDAVSVKLDSLSADQSKALLSAPQGMNR